MVKYIPWAVSLGFILRRCVYGRDVLRERILKKTACSHCAAYSSLVDGHSELINVLSYTLCEGDAIQMKLVMGE